MNGALGLMRVHLAKWKVSLGLMDGALGLMRGALSLMGVHLAKWTPSFSLMSALLSLMNQVFNERTP